MGWTVLGTLAALVSGAGAPVRQPLCEPSAEVQRAIDEAVPPAPLEADFERALSSLRAVRERFPKDLFVHVRYEDAVFDGGTEGHLKGMLREYRQLSADHPEETHYEYLAGRAHLGRGTKKAIAAMERILERDDAHVRRHPALDREQQRRTSRARSAPAGDGAPSEPATLVVVPEPDPVAEPGRSRQFGEPLE